MDRVHFEPPTVSKMLDRMEKASLVERRRDPEDARLSRVYLTDRSRGLEASVQQLAQRFRFANQFRKQRFQVKGSGEDALACGIKSGDNAVAIDSQETVGHFARDVVAEDMHRGRIRLEM